MKTIMEKGSFGVDVSIGLMFAIGNTLATVENTSTLEDKVRALTCLCALVKANPDFIEITDKKDLEELKILGQKAYELGKAQINSTKEQKQFRKREKNTCTK